MIDYDNALQLKPRTWPGLVVRDPDGDTYKICWVSVWNVRLLRYRGEKEINMHYSRIRREFEVIGMSYV